MKYARLIDRLDAPARAPNRSHSEIINRLPGLGIDIAKIEDEE